jgi:hypothetical protein
MHSNHSTNETNPTIFDGNIYIFYAFDIGEDIDFEKIERHQPVLLMPYSPPKYFKNYQIPLNVELPHPHDTSSCFSARLLRFGVMSLIYKIPFSDTLENLQQVLIDVDEKYQNQSVHDAKSLYRKILPYIIKPKFFHLRTSYTVIQANPIQGQDARSFKEKFGNHIASLVRFETINLSAEQRNEILASAQSYYRGDLVVIDTEATFISDPEYHELIEIFEFANIQQLELQYYDQVLSKKLNTIYESRISGSTWGAYLPFVNTHHSATLELGRLRVDISVVTEQLENSLKLTGDPYLSAIYLTLCEQLDLEAWQKSISKKLEIIQDVRSIYENQVTSIRSDMLSVLVIILIFIELIIGLMGYMYK